LSHSLCGVAAGVGVPLGDAAAVVVVVAGEIPGIVAEIIGFGVTVAPGTAEDVVVVVVAGLIAVAGLVTGAGAVVVVVLAGAVAGLVAGAGGTPGGFVAGEVAGGGWPKELKAMVTEKRLAISVVFIG
jgi:hypothetical protein